MDSAWDEYIEQSQSIILVSVWKDETWTWKKKRKEYKKPEDINSSNNIVGTQTPVHHH